ncbi:hypothetical protein BV898_12201 [Hypsibius exemplaris]|uniref:G domain-containing protein n=1 Tax=Hypsibius exemplaris TaxID=2072580 RepID=A0A1W0WEC7_HYPEX|nr:hypothetical protein BV898_12201 [Hypsibius exemplaris]
MYTEEDLNEFRTSKLKKIVEDLGAAPLTTRAQLKQQILDLQAKRTDRADVVLSFIDQPTPQEPNKQHGSLDNRTTARPTTTSLAVTGNADSCEVWTFGQEQKLHPQTVDKLIAQNFRDIGDLDMLTDREIDDLKVLRRDALRLKKLFVQPQTGLVTVASTESSETTLAEDKSDAKSIKGELLDREECDGSDDVGDGHADPGGDDSSYGDPGRGDYSTYVRTYGSETTAGKYERFPKGLNWLPGFLSNSADRSAFMGKYYKLQQQGKLQPIYNIMLLGETGSGKSTLINYITNFFLNGTLKHPKISVPTTFHNLSEDRDLGVAAENIQGDQRESKTMECGTHRFPLNQQFEFRFIDTPGLSDTRGTDFDDLNLERIRTAAEKAGTFAAVIVVINGTAPRATVTLNNTMTRLKGSMPDVLLNNLLILLTNCSRTGHNFQLASLSDWNVDRARNVFFMNNSAFSHHPAEWSRGSPEAKEVSQQWEKSMAEICRILCRIAELTPTSTECFRTMQVARNKIKGELGEILLEIRKLQTLHDSLELAKQKKNSAGEELQLRNNAVVLSKSVDYFVKEDAPNHSTFCLKHSDKCCHENCRIALTQTKGDEIFKGCLCMSGGKLCTVCGCDFHHHYHEKKILVKKSRTTEEILADMKTATERLDTQNKLHQDCKNEVRTLKTAEEAIKHELKVKEGMIKDCCRRLKEVCKNFNFVDEFNIVLQMLATQARSIKSVQARQEADQLVRNMKLFIDQFTGDTGSNRYSNRTHPLQGPDFHEQRGSPMTGRPERHTLDEVLEFLRSKGQYFDQEIIAFLHRDYDGDLELILRHLQAR